MQDGAVMTGVAVTIPQPIFKITFAECECEKLKVAPEPQPTLPELPESPESSESPELPASTEYSEFVDLDTVDKSVKWKEPTVSPSDELDDEHELNGCQLWGNNWRQFTSVLPGILLLFTIGLHNVFSVYELDYFTTDSPAQLICSSTNRSAFDPVGEYGTSSEDYLIGQQPTQHSKSTTVVMMWYLGAIVGGLLAAALLTNMKKRSIYVS